MTNINDFEIKYWAGGNDFSSQKSKSKRSIKRKLFIVFCFVAGLALAPILLFGLSNLKLNQGEKVSVIQKPVTEQPNKVTITEPEKPVVVEEEIINNDSYWKISKRVCGTGKYYLSVRDQNNSKALYKGETVTVTCTL